MTNTTIVCLLCSKGINIMRLEVAEIKQNNKRGSLLSSRDLIEPKPCHSSAKIKISENNVNILT